MQALVTDPFEDDAVGILEWAYGPRARYLFMDKRAMGQRAGQAFMNTLCMFDAASFNRLTGSLVDPFHDDSKIPAVLDMLTSM